MNANQPSNIAPVIECRDLCKHYQMAAESYASLKETLLRGGLVKRSSRTIHALQNLNAAIYPGEVVGLIGDNGSGKSTLLKLIAGITEPSAGSMTVRGAVSSLLEVGVGFHPDMTGRENVYLSGSLLGISRQDLDARMDDIIAFSELHEFIDAPVKHYSSGMYLRLGFAIGIYVDPDILLVDEILAVGDQRFQRKCKEHIRMLRQSGKTILVVSHDLDAILALCQRALVLHKGELLGDGPPYEMITLYRQHQFMETRRKGEVVSAEIIHRNRWGKFDLRFTDARMFDQQGNERYVFETGEAVRVEFAWQASRPIEYPIFGLSFISDQGEELYTIATDVTVGDIEQIEGEGKTVFCFDSLNLLEGAYSITFGATQRTEGPGSVFNFYEGFDLQLERCPFLVKPGSKGYGVRGHTYMPCAVSIKAGADD